MTPVSPFTDKKTPGMKPGVMLLGRASPSYWMVNPVEVATPSQVYPEAVRPLVVAW